MNPIEVADIKVAVTETGGPPVRVRTLAILITSLVLACAAPALTASPEADFVYTGRGYFEGDTTPSYHEHYVLRLRGGEPVRVRTEYRERGGAIRAVRTLEFGAGRAAWRPVYRFRDRATGYEEGADPRAGSSSVVMRVYKREETGDPVREKILNVPAPVVVDGGFVPFLRAHWDTLMTGAHVPFNFVAVSHLDWFAMELSRDEDADREGAAAFVAQARHAALRFLIAPTRVWFDPATRRMVEFRGRSNLHGAKGKTRPVRLLYTPMRPAP